MGLLERVPANFWYGAQHPSGASENERCISGPSPPGKHEGFTCPPAVLEVRF
jgi:hypothetical protein